MHLSKYILRFYFKSTENESKCVYLSCDHLEPASLEKKLIRIIEVCSKLYKKKSKERCVVKGLVQVLSSILRYKMRLLSYK